MSIRGSIGRSGLLRLSPLSDQASQDAVAMAAFAEKRWVWVEDKREGYIAGYITRENGEEVDVQLNNDELRRVHINQTEKMNPPKFDKVEDMADLTYLNEASVVHNLRLRYLSNLIYTYSGLFLVAVNPYHRLPIYSDSVVASYKNRKRNEIPPHIFAISDAAYHDMLQDRENQSILITGESGAGKTENTKKVIQYLTSIASERSATKANNGLEQQILQANPILEAFGNAQSIRNNNSSRFGKFIRIEFNAAGQIAGANIERYLLEKSRVTHQTSKERNFHIFYQLLKSTDSTIKDPLLLDGDVNDYAYVKNSSKVIDGVDDAEEFKNIQKSMDVMGFNQDEQRDLFRIVAAILHLGNLTATGGSSDQAQINDTAVAERVCHVLGIPVAEFVRGLLRPKIKAGRDWVAQARNVTQVNFSVEALARVLYERMFGQLIERINIAMDRPAGKSTFIGVLDIAGFEIFETNSFEQLNINYTNEKLQQFLIIICLYLNKRV
ncbi:P-loop containing nucleoside triphosphate hydrolase protein [Syncephalis fuscata]|nr:P-loop containing nucleoside triphosphate hydrolase protein [Syncephalis fuscata]